MDVEAQNGAMEAGPVGAHNEGMKAQIEAVEAL
jgi:hypothetical protein